MTTIAEQKSIIEWHQTHAPVQVVPLAKDLGINVFTRDDWPDNISGRIYRSEQYGGKSGYAIEVNANHHPNRRRFTIAHEIAHFVLHPNLIGDELYDDGLYRSGLSNQVETQANRLAEDILMPNHLLRQTTKKYGNDPYKLASIFEVSVPAMRIRLGWPPEY